MRAIPRHRMAIYVFLLVGGIALAETVPRYRLSFVSSREIQRTMAMNAVRVILTLERAHSQSFGKYVPLNELPGSFAFYQIMNDPKAEEFGLGRSTIEAMSFVRNTDVVPGFDGWLKISDDGQRYTLALLEKRGVANFAFVSDQTGIVYEGNLVRSPSVTNAVRPARELLLDPQPICNRLSAGSAQRMAMIPPKYAAVLPFSPFLLDFTVYADNGFGCNSCGGSCQSGLSEDLFILVAECLCRSLGCENCVWCCCPFSPCACGACAECPNA